MESLGLSVLFNEIFHVPELRAADIKLVTAPTSMYLMSSYRFATFIADVLIFPLVGLPGVSRA